MTIRSDAGWPPRTPRPGRPSLILWSVLGLLVAVGSTACADRSTEEKVRTLATFDSVLVELGHTATSRLDRFQRWRMISSVWTGLPPQNYSREQLPERGSYGPGLLETYCTQCHWLPSPQMHSAEEWPLLVRRMVLRARALTRHLGGPVTRRLMGGEQVLEGMAIAALPSEADQDSIIAYLTRNALPTVARADLPAGEGRSAFVDLCSRCHELPAPDAHPANEWAGVVDRMGANIELIGVEPMPAAHRDRIVSYLEEATSRSE